MAKQSAGTGYPGARAGVRIVVAGEQGTGKSSLIVTAAAENFPTNVPPLLPPTRLPEDIYPDRVPITIIDTSSRYICHAPLSLSPGIVCYSLEQIKFLLEAKVFEFAFYVRFLCLRFSRIFLVVNVKDSRVLC